MFGPPPTGSQPRHSPRQPPHQYRPGPQYDNSGDPTPDLSRIDTPIVNSWSHANHQTWNIPSDGSTDQYSTWPHYPPQVQHDHIITPHPYSVHGLPTVSYPSNPHTQNDPSNGSPDQYSTLSHYPLRVQHDQNIAPYPNSVGGLPPVLYPADRSYLPGTSYPSQTSIHALGYPVHLSGPSQPYAPGHIQRFHLVDDAYISRIGSSGREEYSALNQWSYSEHPVNPASAPIIPTGPSTQSVLCDHPFPGTENFVEASIRRVMNEAILRPSLPIRLPTIFAGGSGQSTLHSYLVPHLEERQNPSSRIRGHRQVRIEPAVDQVKQVPTRQAKPLNPAAKSFPAPSLSVAATAKGQSTQVSSCKSKPLNPAAKPFQPPSHAVAAAARGQSLALKSSSSPSGDGLQLPKRIENSLVGAVNHVPNTGPAEPIVEKRKLVFLVRAGEVPSLSDGQLHERHDQVYDERSGKLGYDPELSARGITQCTRLNRETRGGMQRFAQLLLVSPLRRAMETATRGLPELAERLFEREAVKPLSRVDSSLTAVQNGSSSIPSWCNLRAGWKKQLVYDPYPALDLRDIFYARRVGQHTEHTSRRVKDLLKSLWEAPEMVIVAVSHQELLRRMVGNQTEWHHCQVRPFTLHKDKYNQPYLRGISDEDCERIMASAAQERLG